MKRVLLYAVFSLLSPALMSQMVYFFSIDADGPFTLQTGNQIFYSSVTGHVLVPQLKDSTFTLNITFPDNKYPRQRFQVPVNKKDRGFLLKKMEGPTWALYDWQQAELISVLPEQSLNEPSGEKRDDAFAHLMAGVVNDTSVLYAQHPVSVPVDSLNAAQVKGPESMALQGQVNTEPKPFIDSLAREGSTQMGSQPRDSVLNKLSDGKTTNVSPDTANATGSSGKTALIRRLGDSVLKDTRYLLYCDSNDTGIDTISVRIPIQNENTVNRKDDNIVAPPKQAVIVNKREPVRTPAENKDSLLKKVTVGNNGCLNTASDADVDKLRIRMLQETTPDGRLEVARKAFRSQCFSTRQIRGLTELFFSDENRYRFFDVAYPSATDKEPFKALVFFLTDDYYVNRFKAMVRY